jgi:hypothetical protein
MTGASKHIGGSGDKTQVWSMNSHNNYSTQSAGTATAGWQVVAMDQMTGRYLG